MLNIVAGTPRVRNNKPQVSFAAASTMAVCHACVMLCSCIVTALTGVFWWKTEAVYQPSRCCRRSLRRRLRIYERSGKPILLPAQSVGHSRCLVSCWAEEGAHVGLISRLQEFVCAFQYVLGGGCAVAEGSNKPTASSRALVLVRELRQSQLLECVHYFKV